MPAVYCAIPPLDQAATRIGRGFGVGWNRAHTAANQLHAGLDFVADAGTPVVAPLPGDVVLVSHDSGPGYNRAMRGYGNAVVLEHRFDIPGLPNPFWTSYNHMRDAPAVSVGQHVSKGTLLGHVGNTTNGSFPGMGAHLHNELRVRPFPSSYDRDTRDPSILYTALGIDWLGAHREVGRMVGGQMLVRQGGPSDCRAGITPTIAGLPDRRRYYRYADRWWKVVGGTHESPSLLGLGDAVPPGYIDPSSLRTQYPSGSSTSNQNVEPPDYVGSEMVSMSGGFVLVALGVGALWLMRRR